MRILQFAQAKVDSAKPGIIAPTDGELPLPTEASVWKNLLSLKNGQEPFADLNPELPLNQQPNGQRQLFRITQQLSDVQKQQFRNILTSDQTIQDGIQKIVRESRSPHPGTQFTLITLPIPMQPDQQPHQGEEPDTQEFAFLDLFIMTAIDVLSQVLARFANKTDHGFYPTVVEEILRAYYLSNIGKDIWEHIKQETLNAFTPPHHNLPTPAGAAFVQKLREYYHNMGSAPRPQITLVGHSAGSIFICRMLKHLSEALPQDVKFNIIFLAPACTYELFKETLQHYQNRIASIRMFAMQDSVEQSDILVPALYTRSLLYLVSGIFEDVPDTSLLGMQRFFSTDPPFNMHPEISDVLHYLSTSPHDTVWSQINGGKGLSSSAAHHGEFYHEPITLTSLAYMLTTGLL